MKPSKDQVLAFAVEEANRQGVPSDFIYNMVMQESRGKHDAVGPMTRQGQAVGPMQLMAGTAKDLGVNRNDWQDNIRGGVKYAAQLFNRFQDPVLVAAAYNAGPEKVAKYGGVPPFAETQNYVKNVVGASAQASTQKAAGQPMSNAKGYIELPDEEPAKQKPTQSFGGYIEVNDEIAPGKPVQTAKQIAKQSGPSIADIIGRSTGLTARYGLEGLGQTLDIGGAPIASLLRATTGGQYDLPSQSMTKLANAIGLPQPQGKLEESVGNITRQVAGVSPMAKAGQLMSGATNQAVQAVGKGLAAQPGAQVAGAIGGGTTAEIGRQGFDIQNPFALAALNILGGIPASAAAARAGNVMTGTQYANPNVGQTVEAGRARGVNIDVGDVGGPGSATLERMRQISGSTQSANQAKSQQVQDLIEKVTDQARPASVKTAGSEKTVIANDLRTQYRTAKSNVNPLFERAEKLAGNAQISLNNTSNAAANVIDQFPTTATTAVIEKNIEKLNNLIQAGGGTYKEVRDLQKNIGAEMSRVQKGVATGSYSETQASALSKLYSSMADDVDAWAAPRQINGKPVYTPAGAAHEQAMTQFKDTVVPFRENKDIYRLVSSKTPRGEFDEAAQNFSLTKDPTTADRAVSLMSPEGKQAAQYSILNEARVKGITQDAASLFSAPAFMRTLNMGRSELPTAQRNIMSQSPELMNEVNTMRNIVDTTRGAVTPKTDMSTGTQLLPFLASGSAGGVGAATASAMGMSPEIGGLIGAAASPIIGNTTANMISSPSATRFLLGQPNLGSGAAATGVASQLGTATQMPSEQSLQPGSNILELYRQLFQD
jgi:hypothetical protein